MSIKILYINPISQDYLADSLLIGLIQIENVEITQYPSNHFIYNDVNETTTNLYGNGFSLYGIINNDRKSILKRDGKKGIDFTSYDWIIFSCINQQYGLFMQFQSHLPKEKIIIIDGSDSEYLFPYNILEGHFYRLSFPKLFKHFPYFKRELTIKGLSYLAGRITSYPLLKKRIPKNVKPISFSIPEVKIVHSLPTKTNLFPTHIVDLEIANFLGLNQTSYAFSNEADYYKDLQSAKFGITTKRAGWDCMRHYEIAANGTVICFRDLDKKPVTCAPHGLIPGRNCISYHSYANLKEQINQISEENYRNLQKESWEWVKANTCKKRAQEFIGKIPSANGNKIAPASNIY